MKTNKIAAILEIASKDAEDNINALKKALKDNDYKLCSLSANLMLEQMREKGMDEEQRAYWSVLAYIHLPHEPQNALKE